MPQTLYGKRGEKCSQLKLKSLAATLPVDVAITAVATCVGTAAAASTARNVLLQVKARRTKKKFRCAPSTCRNCPRDHSSNHQKIARWASGINTPPAEEACGHHCRGCKTHCHHQQASSLVPPKHRVSFIAVVKEGSAVAKEGCRTLPFGCRASHCAPRYFRKDVI